MYMHKAGINTKLTESCAGPYVIVKQNSSLSYKVNTRDRIIGSVHISLLKKFVPRDPEPAVKRVTTVLEPDSVSDSMDHQYTELVIRGRVDTADRDSDVKE